MILIYGAGKIGRGYLGQLLTLSGLPFLFIDVDAPLVARLSAAPSYRIHLTAGDRFEPFTVTGYSACTADDAAADAAFVSAEAVFTAVGVSNLPALAVQLARGIARRAAVDPKPVNVLLCENKIGAPALLSDLIAKSLPPEAMPYFEHSVGLVGVAVGRTVPVPPASLTEKEPLALYSDAVLDLPYDRTAVLGALPPVAHLKPVEPFELYIRRKLLIHNMCHALTAYLGFALGYATIWQAREDPRIEAFERGALAESSAALAAEYGVDAAGLIAYGDVVLEGFRDRLLGDTVARVGRDPIRKLGPEDRLTGALNLCRRHGVAPKHLCAAVAGGLLFGPAGDPAAAEVSAYTEKNGVPAALKKYAAIDDPTLAAVISGYYEQLKKGELIPPGCC